MPEPKLPGEADYFEAHLGQELDYRTSKQSGSLDAKTTYEVVHREGIRELERSTGALFWSGLAAGLSMSYGSCS